MEADILDGKIGEAGAYDVEFKGGKLLAKVDVGSGPFTGKVELAIDAGKVMDELKKAIPGQIDDAVIDLIKAALIGSPQA